MNCPYCLQPTIRRDLCSSCLAMLPRAARKAIRALKAVFATQRRALKEKEQA